MKQENLSMDLLLPDMTTRIPNYCSEKSPSDPRCYTSDEASDENDQIFLQFYLLNWLPVTPRIESSYIKL